MMILSILFLLWTLPLLLLSGGTIIIEQGLKYAGSQFAISDIESAAIGYFNMSMLKPLWEEIWIGIFGGILTSLGFIPQLVKGYMTKKLDDVSYYMPLVLLIGMMFWLTYGIFLVDIPLIGANVFSSCCNVLLISM